MVNVLAACSQYHLLNLFPEVSTLPSLVTISFVKLKISIFQIVT